MNYRDSSGAWQPIDNTMVPATSQGAAYKNAANSYTARLPQSLLTPIQLAAGGHAFSVTLEQAAGTAKAAGNSVTYASAFPGVDVSYTSTANSLEDRLLLRDASSPSSFTYLLSLNGGTAKQEADGSIAIFASDGSAMGRFLRPVVVDSSGPRSASHSAVSMTLDPLGQAITVSVDSTWLASPTRAWPITIDPSWTYNIIDNNVANTCVLYSAPYDSENYCGDGWWEVTWAPGSWTERTLLSFSLAGIPPDSDVIDAQVQAYITSGTNSTDIGLYQVTQPYTTAATWDTYDGVHPWASPGGDFASTAAWTTPSVGPTGSYGGEPTALVQGWLDGSIPNYGLMVKEPVENTNADEYFNTTPPSGSPTQLVVYWGSRVGLRPYYTQINQQLTDHLALSVNPATGNAEFQASDMSVQGVGMNWNETRYLNSMDVGFFGGSWSSEATDVGVIYEGGGAITFYTPDNEIVTFTKTSASQSTWTPPPGFNATITGADASPWRVTFDQGQDYYDFNQYELLVDHVDRNGDKISFAQDSDNCIQSVTDTEGRVFNYNVDITTCNVLGITDVSGNRSMSFTYPDSTDATYTDANGKTTSYKYDASGRLTQITDPVGNITLANYDSLSRITSLTRVTDNVHLTGPTWTFTYNADANDAAGNTIVTDPNNHQTTYYYDDLSRVTSVKDGRGYTQATTVYDNLNNAPYSVTDHLGNKTSYTYDDQNNPTNLLTAAAPPQQNNDTAAVHNYKYDTPSSTTGYQFLPSSDVAPLSNGNDTNGECTAYTYDPAGNVIEVSPGHGLSGTIHNCDGAISPILYQYGRQGDTLNGSSVSCTGAKPGEICYTKDANNNQTSYAYDSNGNLVSATPPTPMGKTTYAVDADSRVSTVTDGLGNTGTAATIASVQTGDKDWSSSGVSSVTVTMPASVTAGDAVVLQVATKASNPVVTVSSVTGGGLTWTKGPTKSSTTAGDVEIWYGTGSSGGSASITATLSAGTDQAAAFAQEFTGVASASALDTSGSATGNNNHMASPSLTTTKAGDVVWMTGYGASKITAWPASPWQSLNGPKFTDGNYYDSIAWQVAATTGAYSATWTLAANANWNTVGLALKAGSRLTAYTYDNLDRVTQVLYGGAKACVPSTGDCISYTYDADGNLKTQADQSGTTTYTYDALNRVIEKDVASSPSNACSGYSGMRYSYDGVGNLLSYCDSGGTITYTYDAANNVVGLAEPGGNCTPGQIVQPCTILNYDPDERLASYGANVAITLPTSTGTVVQISYDNASNVDVIEAEKGTSGCATQNSTTCFMNNNYFWHLGTVDTGIVQQTTDTNATGATFNYVYDARDQLTHAQESGAGTTNYYYTYDNNGNRLCGQTSTCTSSTYTYNADNELTQGPTGAYTYDANGSELTSHGLTNLTYNPKVQTTSITPSGKSAEAMTYAGSGQGDRLSLGTTMFANGIGGQVMESVNGSTTIYFTRLPNGQLFSMRTGGKSYYYLTDHLGTVVGLLDNTGSRTNGATYSYDPYGQQLTSSGNEKAVNPYGFAGGYYDSNALLMKFGQRYYDPATGRWTQLDPSGHSPGYAYVGNSPTTSVDPTGESARKCAPNWFSNFFCLNVRGSGLNVTGISATLNFEDFSAENFVGMSIAIEVVEPGNHLAYFDFGTFTLSDALGEPGGYTVTVPLPSGGRNLPNGTVVTAFLLDIWGDTVYSKSATIESSPVLWGWFS